MQKPRIFLILVLTTSITSILLITAVSAVSQNTIHVTTPSDNTNAGDNFCTLREAINNANADGDTTSGDCEPGIGDDTILIPSGPFLLLNNGPDDDANLTGDLDIMSSLTLQGAYSISTSFREFFIVRISKN